MSLVGAEHHVVNAVNVRAAPFGASGNGVTNDTAAVQAAIDAASLSNRRVYFPAGNYKVDELSITRPIMLEGELGPETYDNDIFVGKFTGIIGTCLTSRSGGRILHYTAGPHVFGGVRNIRFSGGSPIYWSAITEDTHNFLLENIAFEDSTGWCFDNYDLDLVGGAVYQFHWRNIQINNCAKGLRLCVSPASTLVNVYLNSYFQNSYGIEVKGGSLLCLGVNQGVNPHPGTVPTGGNTGATIKATGCHLKLWHCQFEGFYGTAVKIDGTVYLHVMDTLFMDGLNTYDPVVYNFGVAIDVTGDSGKDLIIKGHTRFIGGGWKNGTPLHYSAAAPSNEPKILLLNVPNTLAFDGVPYMRFADGTQRQLSMLRTATDDHTAADPNGVIRQWMDVPYSVAKHIAIRSGGSVYHEATSSWLPYKDGSFYLRGLVRTEAGIVLQSAAAAPSSPATGQMYFNTSDNRFYGFNGTVWKQLDN